MKKILRFCTIAIAVSFASCSDYITDTHVDIVDSAAKINRISATDSILSPTDASVVALFEKYGATATKSGSSAEIDEIIPLYSDGGEVIMYAVNFKGGGYTVVSATKKYYPILMQSEYGRFSDEIYQTAASIFLDEFKTDIAYSKTLHKDSLAQVKQMWSKYEELNGGGRVQTKSDPLLELVDASIKE